MRKQAEPVFQNAKTKTCKALIISAKEKLKDFAVFQFNKSLIFNGDFQGFESFFSHRIWRNCSR